jgi:hypothetical protein
VTSKVRLTATSSAATLTLSRDRRAVLPAAGATIVGLDADGIGNYKGDPHVDSRLLKARAEPEIEKRRTMVKTCNVTWPSNSTSFATRAAPAVLAILACREGLPGRPGSNGSFHGAEFYYWLNKTKPPLKKT